MTNNTRSNCAWSRAARNRVREPEPEKSEEEMVAIKDLFKEFGQNPRGFANKLKAEKGGR